MATTVSNKVTCCDVPSGKMTVLGFDSENPETLPWGAPSLAIPNPIGEWHHE